MSGHIFCPLIFYEYLAPFEVLYGWERKEKKVEANQQEVDFYYFQLLLSAKQ